MAIPELGYGFQTSIKAINVARENRECVDSVEISVSEKREIAVGVRLKDARGPRWP